MKSKERVIKTLEFGNPDRIPLDIWVLPATRLKYGKDLDELFTKYPVDFYTPIYQDPLMDKRHFQKGHYVDKWGVGWNNLQEGIHPEAKQWPLADYEKINTYRTPVDSSSDGWEDTSKSIKCNSEKFVIAPIGNPFERMQFLRGTENLFIDLAEDHRDVYKLRDMVFDFYIQRTKRWVKYDIDAISLFDDWGSQNSLLISPIIWRSFFKPLYREIINVAKENGKYVFFHSDGNILPLFEDFIELGVNAINSQLWCMDINDIASRFAGKITFWGEISRQDTLPYGSPGDIMKAAEVMKKHLWVNDGGLIGEGEVGPDVPLANIEMLLKCWNGGSGHGDNNKNIG